MSFIPFTFQPFDSKLPATWSRTVTGTAIAVANGIKTSVATAVTLQTYITTALNGSIGAAQFALPQTVSVTTTSSAGSYTATGIVFTGLDCDGNVLTETLTLTAVNGGETINGTKPFAQVTSIVVPAQGDAMGHFTFGVGDILLPTDKAFREVRGSTAANIKVGFQDGSTDTLACIAGEHHKVLANRIYSTSTTVASLTVYA